MTSSYAAENKFHISRAKVILSIFSNIGLGSTTSGIVYVILLQAFKSSIEKDTYHIQWVWRLLLGIGLVPLICTLYARLTMKESKPYEQCRSLVPETEEAKR